MIPDDVLTLLTAAVDGELTLAEAERVRGLIAESPDVRAAFRRLKADRLRLRRLPLRTPPADLHARVMARLPARPPVPTEIVRPMPRPRTGSWVPVGMAASVLLTLTGGSFWFFVNQPQPGPGAQPAAVAQVDTAARERQWAKVLPRETAPPPSAPAAIDTSVEPVGGTPTAAVPVAPEVAPSPRPVARDVLTFPPLPDVGKLDLARVRVPFLATVAEFEREDVQQLFAAELGQDSAFRIDLFARDPGRGAELFQAAAKASGLAVYTDRMTADRVQRKQAAAYLVYTDSLSATDLRALMSHLAAADAKAPQRTFDAVHATPAAPTDQRELRDVLGTDPGLWKRPVPPAAEPKSVSSGTAEQLTRSLTDPAAGKGGERSAILTTFAPTQARTPPGSRDIRQFFERRPERRPNAVPVLIVIRQAIG
jgi:hypothetical protein